MKQPYEISSDIKHTGTEYKLIFYINSKNGRTVCECYSDKMARKICKFLIAEYYKRKTK